MINPADYNVVEAMRFQDKSMLGLLKQKNGSEVMAVELLANGEQKLHNAEIIRQGVELSFKFKNDNGKTVFADKTIEGWEVGTGFGNSHPANIATKEITEKLQPGRSTTMPATVALSFTELTLR